MIRNIRAIGLATGLVTAAHSNALDLIDQLNGKQIEEPLGDGDVFPETT